MKTHSSEYHAQQIAQKYRTQRLLEDRDFLEEIEALNAQIEELNDRLNVGIRPSAEVIEDTVSRLEADTLRDELRILQARLDVLEGKRERGIPDGEVSPRSTAVSPHTSGSVGDVADRYLTQLNQVWEDLKRQQPLVDRGKLYYQAMQEMSRRYPELSQGYHNSISVSIGSPVAGQPQSTTLAELRQMMRSTRKFRP